MSSGVQAGLVQLGIAALLVVSWYTGAWQTIVDELTAGITGGDRQLGGDPAVDLGARSVGGSWGAPPAPTGLRVPTAPRIPTAPRAV